MISDCDSQLMSQTNNEVIVMKRVLVVLISLGLLGGLFYALTFSESPTTEGDRAERLNITVVVDLSNRIDPDRHPGQVARDKAALESVLAAFREEVKRKLFIASHDRLSVGLAPQKGNPAAFGYLDSLSIDMGETPLDERRRSFDASASTFRRYLDTLYADAADLKRYWGADLWRYFAGLQVDTVTASGAPIRNVMVVLSDGYLIAEDNMYREGCRTNYLNDSILEQFREKPNWERKFKRQDCGFIPAQRDLGNLEVLIIGLRPRSYFNEAAILRTYWAKWMQEMGVQRIAIHPSCKSPKDCRSLVRGFMEGR